MTDKEKILRNVEPTIKKDSEWRNVETVWETKKNTPHPNNQRLAISVHLIPVRARP